MTDAAAQRSAIPNRVTLDCDAIADANPIAMIAEIISIGDEMTSGARVDTNAQWLSQRLAELGVDVRYHTTVGDTLDDNVDVFRIASRRADVIVSTGGLGPTRDDLTRQSLAAMAGKPLVQQPDAMRHIESMFAKRMREMPQRNRIQAMFPEESLQIFNPQGTAPGIDLTVAIEPGSNQESGTRTSRIFALPGVPAEMKRMFGDTVAPRITQMQDAENVIEHCVMKFFGTGESDMEQRLGTMIDRHRSPRVGITASSATISLRISARASSSARCHEMIAATRRQILENASEFYFGDGESFEQQHALIEALEHRGESLAMIELGQAAPLGDWFAALGKRDAYVGGISATHLESLAAMLGCPPEAVYETFKTNTQADWLVVVDRYPALEADGDAPLPAAKVCFTTFDSTNQREQKQLTIGGHPSILQARIGKTAMMVLRQRMGL